MHTKIIAIIFFIFHSGFSLASSPCKFGAFVQEEDPHGLNVRETPTTKGKILGTLPPSIESKELPGFKVKIEVSVLLGKNGWFQIKDAVDNTSLTGISERAIYKGTGWVSGKKLTIKSQAMEGHAAPNISSASILKTKNQNFDGDSFVEATHLLNCDGEWAEVEVDLKKLSSEIKKSLGLAEKKTALKMWVNQICSIQETSCDGIAK
jgi:hypothetical protein